MKLYELTAHELSEMLRARKIGAAELTRTFLDRIEEKEPTMGSYLTILYEKAINKAEKIQKEFDLGGELPPLAGIPAAIKDNICTEGILTTCASKMLGNFIPPYNATVMEKLNRQEIILLGKLNMDEFAMGGSTENSWFKKTRNPWNQDRVPGGSSGGSAASVAGGEAVFSLGSDTGGSVRQPAAFCGVVGMKPTFGAVSRYGLIAFASSLDQIGPITRDITDCALVLNAISGHDSKDSTSAAISHPDYTKALVNDVKRIRIGIPKEYTGKGVNNEVRKAVLDSAKVLEKLGAVCKECSLPLTEYVIPAYYIISSAEAGSNLARYDGVKYGFRASDSANLLEMYKKTRSEGFGPEVKRRVMLGTWALSSGYYEAYYQKALKVRTLIRNGFDEAFKSFDLILGPTAPTTAYKFGEKVNNPLEIYLGDIFTASANIAGLPALSLPCGFDRDGLPIGLQLTGKSFDESTLLRVGYTFEQNTEHHLARPDFAINRGETHGI